jgi:hypothetical protein
MARRLTASESVIGKTKPLGRLAAQRSASGVEQLRLKSKLCSGLERSDNKC